jgi:hypothetical protein
VLNTCKSNGEPGFGPGISGERVRNTWATCPRLWDNSGKPGLIPDTLDRPHDRSRKAPTVWDGPAAYQLVGGVTAYQGDDG